MRLLLLRHGQSTWNAARRWQGWADPPLSPMGEEQAHHAALALAGAGLDAAVASPLERARRTAEIMASVLHLGAVTVVEDLRERDVGDWSGLTSEEIEARWPGLLDDWRHGRLPQIPGGEGDIVPRVRAALDEVVAKAPGSSVLVVTHGGVIRGFERALGAEPQGVGNLGGRWVEVHDDGTLVAGQPVMLWGPEGPTTTL